MRFEQSQKQQAALAPVMQRSLQCLQMSSYDLFRYVQDEAMENPVLDVDMPHADLLSDPDTGDETSVMLAAEDVAPFYCGAQPLMRGITVMDKVCRSICTNSWDSQNGWIL